ncbi:MAG: hypothetical protein P8M11_08615 [Planctomycetota bacterium]|nr:hypothetical protein [Planctomycetota bacterium]
MVAAMAVAIEDMSGANRPHELTLSPLVSLLLLVNGGVVVRAIRVNGQYLARRRTVLRGLLHAGLWLYAAGCTLLLVTATSTAIEMLLAR